MDSVAPVYVKVTAVLHEMIPRLIYYRGNWAHLNPQNEKSPFKSWARPEGLLTLDCRDLFTTFPYLEVLVLLKRYDQMKQEMKSDLNYTFSTEFYKDFYNPSFPGWLSTLMHFSHLHAPDSWKLFGKTCKSVLPKQMIGSYTFPGKI